MNTNKTGLRKFSKKSLRLCVLDKSSLRIGKVKLNGLGDCHRQFAIFYQVCHHLESYLSKLDGDYLFPLHFITG